MINGIKNFLVNCYDINRSSLSVSRHPTSKGIARLTVASFPAMKIFKSVLYDDASVYLQRKRDKFDSLNLQPIDWNYIKAKDAALNLVRIKKDIRAQDLQDLGYSLNNARKALKLLETDGQIVLSFIKKNSKYYSVANS